jgi:hypothetical protein
MLSIHIICGEEANEPESFNTVRSDKGRKRYLFKEDVRADRSSHEPGDFLRNERGIK